MDTYFQNFVNFGPEFRGDLHQSFTDALIAFLFLATVSRELILCMVRVFHLGDHAGVCVYLECGTLLLGHFPTEHFSSWTIPPWRFPHACPICPQTFLSGAGCGFCTLYHTNALNTNTRPQIRFIFSAFYTVSQKKGATLTMAITLSILDRFAKFFHCCKQQ